MGGVGDSLSYWGSVAVGRQMRLRCYVRHSCDPEVNRLANATGAIMAASGTGGCRMVETIKSCPPFAFKSTERWQGGALMTLISRLFT